MTKLTNPPPVLIEAVQALPEPAQDALVEHLLGGTSADWISDWLKRAGHPVGATTIRKYRRRLKEAA